MIWLVVSSVKKNVSVCGVCTSLTIFWGLICTQKSANLKKNHQKPPFGDILICKTLKSPEIHCHLTLHGTVGLIWIDFELDFQTIV